MKIISRLWCGFHHSTLASYQYMFRLSLAFLVTLGLPLSQLSTLDILAFMEYLAQSGMSPDHITNYPTAIRSLYIFRKIYFCNLLLLAKQFSCHVVFTVVCLFSRFLGYPINYHMQ